MLTSLAYLFIVLPILMGIYAYLGYPAILWLLGHARARRDSPEPIEWPEISITVPAYNEEAQIRGTIESLLRIDYPAERRQILVVSDASTDRTDEIVREYADRGAELLRMPERRGKGAAENAAAHHLRGKIVINTDASIRIRPDAIKPLVACFTDPSVGVASGRDVSVAHVEDDANRGESGYVGYEMWIRQLETRLSGIVGASGCFYAIRTPLQRLALPEHVSRDFAAAIVAREHGYRSVSVDEATCLVPRTVSLRKEYRRKVRTMTRGMETLWFKRHLLNPLRFGAFAWMLFSHKVCRWLVPWLLPLALVGLAMLAPQSTLAFVLLALAVTGLAMGVTGWALAERTSLPRLLSVPAFALASNVAAIHAGLRAMHGDANALWEPTRREVIATQ
jgi:cellulose synthase/poly-beta-1,6-N-acetylglucosamine synthase-like glycosyltransferase